MEFKNYFSDNSADYHQFRPKYPVPLFAYLASLCPCHEKAWDCATGTGQSALYLSDCFAQVIATDASERQIENAVKKGNIIYRVAVAEDSRIESASIDLITVAQALHWFDLETFAKEAGRVLKDAGIIAVWTYNLLSVQNGVDEIINRLYRSTLDGFWPKERKAVENAYAGIQLPFHAIRAPVFQMSAKWNLSQLSGYLCTWSAVKQYQKQYGINPVEDVSNEILKLWGKAEQPRLVTWPLCLKLWKKKPRP